LVLLLDVFQGWADVGCLVILGQVAAEHVPPIRIYTVLLKLVAEEPAECVGAELWAARIAAGYAEFLGIGPKCALVEIGGVWRESSAPLVYKKPIVRSM
jgi:hypothetical protein